MIRKIACCCLSLMIVAHTLAQNDSIISVPGDTAKLVSLLQSLAAKERNPLLKRHFESVALMATDVTHGFSFTKNTIASATGALKFFQGEGAKWETYANGPRPLMMAFESPTDHKNSFYWLFLPKNWNPRKNDYSFYLELHGSGGGVNDNPRVMLLDPLLPKIAGVTHQGYRKEGLFILPWGRGDKFYTGIAETDIFECLDDFDKQFMTDPQRQYLFGFSMGGAGTYHIALKSMNRWSAIGMYSAAFRDAPKAEDAAKFKNMPVWMAWGETETWAVNDRILKDQLLKAGVKVKWTEVKGVGHNYLGEYQEDLMNWFLEQHHEGGATKFGAETGKYAIMLKQLENDMLNYQEKWIDTLGGTPRNVFVPWIRDHVHVMKAMKYIHPDMESFIEFYLQNQTSEGIYFDYYFPLKYGGSGDRKNIFDKRYWKVFPDENIEMHRLPVEADLEYLLVEGVYAVWQSTADTAFVRKWVPTLVKGLNYSMTDPLRWSKKYQLVKRGYTLDTWDFMQLPSSREEYSKNGGNIQKGIFDIDTNTPMGIMHGDNSGMYAACTQLAKLYAVIGNTNESKKWLAKSEEFRSRTNKLCWNGRYYAHFIEDDPQPAYLKMDQKNTLSLSNPYDINRGLPTESMSQSIISTYKKLKDSNKTHSFAEWYGIYPAVEPHFADYKPGSYMNGGVNTIVGGELAKAAFQHGYESYGVDILNRMIDLMKVYHSDLPVAYTPEGKVDEGIPDNWGQAAVYSALIEGLAGVVDKSTQFRNVEISPRWIAAGIDSADVVVGYGPTGKNIGYQYMHNRKERKISLKLNGVFENILCRILLPAAVVKASCKVNGRAVTTKIEKLNISNYLVVKGGTLVEVIY